MERTPMGQNAASGGTQRRRPWVIAAVVAALVVLPAMGALAAITIASDFDDVSSDSVHAAGIGWMVEAGVTAGCGGNDFCPDNGVTRAQMGTFLHRLSGNAPGIAPSVDAATVQGLGPQDLQGAQGPAGPQGPEGPQGPQGPAGEDATTLFAVMSESGELLRDSGVASAGQRVTAPPLSLPVTGGYVINFEQSVSACAISGVVGSTTGSTVTGVVSVGQTSTLGSRVEVNVRDFDGEALNAPFHVTVTC